MVKFVRYATEGGGGGEGCWKLELVGTQAVYATLLYLSLFPVVGGLCGPGQINEFHCSLQNFRIFSLKLQILLSKGLAGLILTFIWSWYVVLSLIIRIIQRPSVLWKKFLQTWHWGILVSKVGHTLFCLYKEELGSFFFKYSNSQSWVTNHKLFGL